MTMPWSAAGLCAVVVAMVTCVMLASCDGSNGTDATPSSTASSSPPTAAEGAASSPSPTTPPTATRRAHSSSRHRVQHSWLRCITVKSSSRTAWQLVARVEADVYLDCYGVPQLRRRLGRSRWTGQGRRA
jgi:hypothetical protein